ncbi:MAG: glycosyltransferase family 2 protein, partial [Candidatus Hydrogenedentota bacterium]
MTASVVILSRHGYHYLSRLLPALVPCLKQASIPLKNVLVKISPEDEREKNLIQQYPFSHIVIPDDEFNHGGTREQLRTFFATDITIFLTQDILPAQENFLTHLLKPFADRKIGVAYSRQIPHVGADFFESFPREFNYPAQSQIRSLQDLPQYGSFLFFCSNSCAAWRNKALNEVGGFPETITNEDTLATAKLLQAGYKIAYIAESMVYHSHR